MAQDYKTYFREDTVCALITPPGTGGVAICRISGKEARQVAEKVFSKDPFLMKTHTLSFGKILSPQDGSILDEGLCLFMQSPHSFTGEDVIELQFHGGNFIAKKILEALIQAGAKPAHPGEFSFRAYRNGKIDLLQAKGIQELIAARNEKSYKAAQGHLEGKLSLHLSEIKQELLHLASVLEAWVDFPEEGLEFMSFEEMKEALLKQKTKLLALVDSYKTGKMAYEGAVICLVGEPNVGKSSLMNALLGKSRAIVTPIAGTTRDVIEDDFLLFDLSCRLKDTAGIRKTDEIIEQEGIERSLKALEEADAILFIKEALSDFSEKEKALLEKMDLSRTLVVLNKMDEGLGNIDLYPTKALHISAKKEWGLEELKKELHHLLMSQAFSGKEELMILDADHKDTLLKIVEFLNCVIKGFDVGISCEFIVLDLKEALKLLGSLVGMDVTEDVLTALFSKFCVGK